jgi:hypothetical protein
VKKVLQVIGVVLDDRVKRIEKKLNIKPNGEK